MFVKTPQARDARAKRPLGREREETAALPIAQREGALLSRPAWC
jgi:hypothetical protein